MIVFNTPWLRLLGDNVRDRRDSVDDERVEELGDERCFRRDCDGGERSSVLIWIGGVHASKVDVLDDGGGVLNLRAVVASFPGLLTFQSGDVVGDLTGLDSCAFGKMGVAGAEITCVFDCRVEFREL